MTEETWYSYRDDRDAFWDFFQKRGGLRTFGYPVSRDFLFYGCTTQLFQRVAMQRIASFDGTGESDGVTPQAAAKTAFAKIGAILAKYPIVES